MATKTVQWLVNSNSRSRSCIWLIIPTRSCQIACSLKLSGAAWHNKTYPMACFLVSPSGNWPRRDDRHTQSNRCDINLELPGVSMYRTPEIFQFSVKDLSLRRWRWSISVFQVISGSLSVIKTQCYKFWTTSDLTEVQSQHDDTWFFMGELPIQFISVHKLSFIETYWITNTFINPLFHNRVRIAYSNHISRLDKSLNCARCPLSQKEERKRRQQKDYIKRNEWRGNLFLI